VLDALSKCSWREFGDTNGRQVSDDVTAKLGRLVRLLGFDLPHAASFDRRRLLISAVWSFLPLLTPGAISCVFHS
jgi:hypothetical protein